MRRYVLLLACLLVFAPWSYAAVTFDGVDDWITAGDNGDISGAFTLMAWVKPLAIGTHQIIASKFDVGDTADQSYYLSLFTTSTLRGLVASGILSNTVNGSTTLVNGTWYHAAVTWDGNIANAPIVYLNGVNDSTSPSVNMAASPLNITASFIIGARENGGSLGQFCNCAIDDVRFYAGRAYTAAEVHAVWASKLRYFHIGTTPSMYLPLNDCASGASGNGVTFRDRAGSAMNGTGDDGANNTGLTCGGSILSHPGDMR